MMDNLLNHAYVLVTMLHAHTPSAHGALLRAVAIGFVTRRSARHCRTPVALSVQRKCGRLHSAAAMTRSLQFYASAICIDT
jgi:hypothetical protein